MTLEHDLSATPDSCERRVAFLLDGLTPREWPSPEPGAWIDPLGVRTRCSFRSSWKTLDGVVIRKPDHEPIEWLALLEAVSTAEERFCMIELGAGHGPWIVRAGTAWRRTRPGRPMLLVGVEAEPEHFRFLRQHAADNGLDSSCVRLVEAAVSDRDGDAEFEVSRRPSADWGTRLVEGPEPVGLPRVCDAGRRFVRSLSLEALAAGLGDIDLLHVDIQGSEVPVLTAGADLLRRRTRRIVVGTHGREIEGALLELLSSLGFWLEFEKACRYRLDASPPPLVEDGVQYWINSSSR